MQIAILCGGTSSEKEISLRSGAAVAAALQSSGYDIKTIDPAIGTNELKATLEGMDVVFPVLHGSGGEDGTIQQILEDLSLPYVGSGIEASRLCFDKWTYRQFLQQHSLPVAEGALVSEQEFWASPLHGSPFVLKPHTGGSSIDTLIIRNPQSLDKQQVQEVFSRHDQMLLESLIEGHEITVGVLGSKALPVIEIIPPPSGEFDFKNKYNGKTREVCPPENITAELQTQAQELAEKIHTLTGCRDMSRTDMIVTPTGQLYVLETNTIPGMTDQSLLPKAAAASGIPMPQLVKTLVEFAIARIA